MSIIKSVSFEKAVPVWQAGMECEKNHNLLFRAVVPAREGAVLRIAGHTHFQLRVNGRFVAVGPARAGHGYYRVDEYALDGLLTEPENVISVLVAGYAVNSFAYLDMPSFLCCEVFAGEELLAATGVCGFEAVLYTQRVKKVQRYSFQRPFAESYVFDAAYDDAACDPAWRGETVELAPTEEKNFITRRAPYSAYEFVPVCESISRGGVKVEVPEKRFADRAIVNIGEQLMGYTVDELEQQTAGEAECFVADNADTAVLPGADADIPADGYVTFRLPCSLTGMPELTVTALEDTTLYLTFDELYVDGQVKFLRLGTSSVIVWKLAGGTTYTLRGFEPYTMQYLNLFAMGGSVQVRGLGLRRFDFPDALLTKKLDMPTERLQKIYDAAVETFRQNTVDVYMDCPSRERAGWLCDSFFTSRVEKTLTGASAVERCFLENFLLPESFKCLPEGMLPMCYPSDHYDGVFIPNWAMWFVLELEEYQKRSGDEELIEAAKPRVYALLDYFKKFENADGLLEKLESWVFLEWSRSNQLVQDINFPSNMLYARMLESVAVLYGDEELRTKAKTLKETIRTKCFLGDFFCDNAVYDADGVARLSGEATESCQYYAFFTGVATPRTFPKLWETLVKDFGPDRRTKGSYPQIAFANAFIGNYLRLELLYREGLTDKVVENTDGYFHYMAERTGTLWENVDVSASCNHGFASHVIYWLNGIYGKKR